MLVLDADNNGLISRKNEFVFTEWDPSAESDFDALKQVFDTNHNGKLDAGDARWAEFKVMVNGQMVTLASLGIQSIDLTATGSGQTFADGSAIKGTSVFTRTDGTTGIAGDATLAVDDNGYILTRVPTTNANGSITTDLRGFSADGSLAFQNLITVSADGLLTTTQFDDDGNGIQDRSQTIQKVLNGDGSTLETVSNFRSDGTLRDRVKTTTSADHKTITTEADQDGDSLADQIQQFTTNVDGSTTTQVRQVAVNGALLKEVVTTASADGLVKTIETDTAGRAIYDRTSTETTVINGDGSRTESVFVRRTDQGLISKVITITSADSLTRTIETDESGDNNIDVKQVNVTTLAANNDITVATEERNRDASLRGKSLTTVTADGLSRTEKADVTSDGVFDRVTTSVTVVDGTGTRTTTEMEKSANATLLSKSILSTSADNKTIIENVDANGDGYWDAATSKLVGTDGATVETVSAFNANGSLLSRQLTTSATGGLSQTVKTDMDGDGSYDTTESYVLTANADNSRTETETTTSRNASLIDKTVTNTSADGLTQTVQTDVTGDGVFDTSTTQAIVLNADASRTTTVTTKNANGSLAAKTVTLLSADRKTTTVQTDANGDTKNDSTVTDVLSTTGARTITTSQFNANASLKAKSLVTVTASGLSTTTKTDVTGDGVYDETVTDNTSIGSADSAISRTISRFASNGQLLSKTNDWTAATGLSKSHKTDRDGNAVYEIDETDSTYINSNGSRTQTLSKKAQDGTVFSKTTLNFSANTLYTTMQYDLNGDTVIDLKGNDRLTLNADGSQTRVENKLTGADVLLAKTTTTTSANKFSVTKQTDLDGNSVTDVLDARIVAADGSATQTITVNRPDGVLASKQVKTVNASKLVTTTQIDQDGNGTNERSIVDTSVLNADGSTTQTVSETDAAGALKNRTVADTSANKLTTTTNWDGTGAGATTRKMTSVTVLQADGGRSETVSNFKAGNALNDRTITTVTSDKLTMTTSRDIDGDAQNDQTATVVVQANGSTIATYTDFNAVGTVIGKTIVTTSASGLSMTREHMPASLVSSNRFDWTSTDVTIINTDGSRKQTISEYNVTYSPSEVRTLRNKAVVTTSGNGLSKTTEWDLTGGGTFGESETDVVTLNANGSETRTVSRFVGATLTKQEVATASGDGLSETSQWTTASPTGNLVETSTDVTVLNANGTRTQTVTNTRADGSLLSKTVTLISTDGLTETVQEDTLGAGTFDRTTSRVTLDLADGGELTTTTRTNADGSVRDKTVARVSGDERLTSITRDLLGNGAIEQTETIRRSVDGSETTVVSNFRSDGQLADLTTMEKSFDGRSITTTWDLEGDGVVDQRRTAVKRINADGSELETISDYNAANVLKRRTTVTVSADKKTRVLSRDENGNGTADHVETVILDVSGALTATTINTGAALTLKPSPGSVEWVPTIAAKTVTKISADGLSKVVQADYDGNGTLEHTETTVTLIDGSSVTTIKDVNASNVVTAQGTLTVSIDGKVVKLVKDSNNDGYSDHIETATTRADGSITRTAVDRNADATLKQTIVETVNAAGKVLMSATTDALGRKTGETVLLTDGTTTTFTFDGASTEVLTVARFNKEDTMFSFTSYDPLNANTWTRIEQYYDETGARVALKQFNDNGSRHHTEYYVPTGEEQITRYYNASNQLYYIAEFDVLNSGTWAISYRGYSTTTGLITQQVEYMDDSDDYYYEYLYHPTTGAMTHQYLHTANGMVQLYPVPREHRPVLLDLNGDNHIDLRMFNPVDVQNGTGPRFDWDGDGARDGTAWLGSADGFLAIDLGANAQAGADGTVDQAQELAFSMWATPEQVAEHGEVTDLEGLQLAFDTNHDDKLDAADARWSEFRVWQDLNQDGLSQSGELKTMTEAGIKLINLVPSSAGAISFPDGSAITGTSSFEMLDGSLGKLVGDAKLAYSSATPPSTP